MDTYNSTQYNSKNENKTLLIDLDASGSNKLNTNFTVNLQKKLILDQEYELYFESIVTFNTYANNSNNYQSFIFKLKDFNINSNNTNNNVLLDSNSIVIPNNCNTDGNSSRHKSKKLNYICNLLPMNISTINFSLSIMDSSTPVSIFSDEGRAIIELLLIPKKKNLSDKEKSELDLYLHNSYVDKRYKNLIIDLESTTASNDAPFLTNFSVDLQEPLIIDRKSEIYLDSKIINAPNGKDNINNMGILLNVNEFDINNRNNNSNSNLSSNKVLIPNENNIFTTTTTTTTIEDFSNATTGSSPTYTPASSIFNDGNSDITGDVPVADAGPGTSHDGFDSTLEPQPTDKYLRFYGGNTSGIKAIKTKNIRSLLSSITSFELYFIIGNDSNGGENPDNNEDLVLRILDEDSNIVTDGTFIIGEGNNSRNVIDANWQLFTASSTILNKMNSDGHFLKFEANTGQSNEIYDHFGIKHITLQNTTTTHVNIPKPLKANKYNYISTINPKIIKNISGSISNLNNQTIVSSEDSRVVMNFLIKPCL